MIEKETKGTVVSVATQWWLKINTSPLRTQPLQGAIFPHVIKVRYEVDGVAYIRRKWISAGSPVPGKGSSVTVRYREDAPRKAKILSL